MTDIFCFGDSITYGAFDLALSGWVTRLRLHFDNLEDPKFNGLVHNLGISGETTDGLIKRFVQETETRLSNKKENIFIFAYGANDANLIPSCNTFMVDIERFEKNLNTAILEAKKFSSKILILTITPVIENLTNDPAKDKTRMNENIEKYNDTIKIIAKENNIKIVDVNSIYLKQGYSDLFCKDGLHPNDKGHDLIFKTVLEEIKTL